jgi:hypothetical protein
VSYLPLTQLITTAGPDTTGKNTGNLTNAFTTAITPRVSWYECYHIVITNVPSGASATINIGNKLWDFTFPVSGAAWDPSQPMLLQAGQEIYFLWTAASNSTPLPIVVMWLRYDPSLPGNPQQPLAVV